MSARLPLASQQRGAWAGQFYDDDGGDLKASQATAILAIAAQQQTVLQGCRQQLQPMDVERRFPT